MSSLSASQAKSPNKEPSWKWLFIKAAGFGVGLAFTLAILAGAVLWYWNRPKPPKGWDNASIKGSYYRVQRIQENKAWKLNFEFVLENITNKDYELNNSSRYRLAGKLEDTSSLTGFADNFQIILKVPIFVPAHQKTRIDIVLPDDDVDVPVPNGDSKEEIHKYYDAVARAVSEKMANLNGFMLFDEDMRYQIELPSGWKKGKK
jgi:hypothetical protein